jgi:TolB protein
MLCGFVCLLSAGSASAQDWFKTGTGLGVSKARVGVADFAAKDTPSQPLADLFCDVVRTDLDYSGILELVSKSFNPLQKPATPQEVDYKAWAAAPATVQLLAFGNFSTNGTSVEIQAWLNDVRDSNLPPVIGKVYRGEATATQVRVFAHQFADEIISKLSGGLAGIASTQIAFVSNRSGNKEIWVMDYDGENQHQLTQTHTIALTPRWSPDASRIAFTCYAQPGRKSVFFPRSLESWYRFHASRAPIPLPPGRRTARSSCSCPACWAIRNYSSLTPPEGAQNDLPIRTGPTLPHRGTRKPDSRLLS